MLNAAQRSSMKALNAHMSLTESSAYRSKLLQLSPGSFLMDSVYYTMADTPHIISNFALVARFAAAELRSMAGVRPVATGI